MGVYDKYAKLPSVNPTGIVYGRDFNQAMNQVMKWLRYDMDAVLYPVHPNQLGGSFPDIATALAQSSREVPVGSPIYIGLWPSVTYDENVVITDAIADDHDVYLINPFPLVKDYNAPAFRGNVTLPPTLKWATGQRKVFGLSNISLANQGPNQVFNVQEGWDFQAANCYSKAAFTINRWQGAEGSEIHFDGVKSESEFYMLDQDDGTGIGTDKLIFTDCELPLLDLPVSSFQLRGTTTQVEFKDSILPMAAITGAGFLDLTAGGTPFGGSVISNGCDWLLFNATPAVTFAANSAAATMDWRGHNTIQLLPGGPPLVSFVLAAWNAVVGWPTCRLGGLMPTNPPSGCRASDDLVDYRDKTWSGGAWV